MAFYFETILNRNYLLVEELRKFDYRLSCVALNEGKLTAKPISVSLPWESASALCV